MKKTLQKKVLKPFMMQQVKAKKKKIQRNFENEGWFSEKKYI